LFRPANTNAAEGSPAGSNAAAGSIETALLAPAGNYSMVTVRRRPDLATTTNANAHDILCAAPSPDWATALAIAQQISGSGSAPGGPSASLSASNSLTETITALAGRTAGVVALRDGLYNACQAYANGVIGKDGYALVLSQYGNLLVALAGSSSGGGGGGTSSSPPASSTPSGVAVAVSTGAAPSSSGSPAASPGGNTPSAGNAALAQLQLEVLQGVLVACISESDPSVVVQDRTPSNRLLNPETCQGLIGTVMGQAKTLLTPAGSSSPPPAKSTPDAAVMAQQKQLQQCDPTLQADGVLGPKTIAAIRAGCPAAAAPKPPA
jgi:hypothetical protein